MSKEIVKITTFSEYIETKRRFYIAMYQRKFVWTNEKIDEFLDEVIEVAEPESKTDRIFGGTFYLRSTTNNGWEIIDGQQRTTFLFGMVEYILPVIDKIILELKDAKGKTKKSNHDLLVKLRDDLSQFEIKLEKRNFDSVRNRKNSRTHKAFKHIESYLDNYFDNDLGGETEDIIKFILAFFNKIDFIEITISDQYDINDIFKTINSRNAKLSDWEVVRNDIYNKLSKSKSSRLSYIDKTLKSMKKTLSIAPEEFVQSYLTAKLKKLVNKKGISKSFDELNKKFDGTNVYDEFYEYVKRFWKNYESNIKDKKPDLILNYFKIVSEMRSLQVKVISLSIVISNHLKELDNWKAKEDKANKEPILRNFIPNQVRRLFINFVLYVNIFNQRANGFNSHFTNNDHDNIKKVLNNYEELDVIIDNSLFFEYNKKFLAEEKYDIFSEFALTNRRLIRFLIWIELSENDGILDFGEVMKYEYEHVMPTSIDIWEKKYEWVKSYDEDSYQESLSELGENIGNIILLNKSMNVSSSNKSFKDKLDIYYDDSNEIKIITKSLPRNGDYELLHNIFDLEGKTTWDRDVIKKRSEMITKIIWNAFQVRIESPEHRTLLEYIKEALVEMDVTEFKSSDIYELVQKKVTPNTINENYASIENFRSKIRQTIQYNTKNSNHFKYEEIFERVNDKYRILDFEQMKNRDKN